ncbi:MAG TPA: cytidine deaminase [Terriglobia bacterium]|nr:cytidine deaminase [Terriglobia bacterium]
MDDKELVRIARETLNPRRLSAHAEAGGVGCALVSERGNIYRGVCIDTACSMGFCAEHAAIAGMVTAGENQIASIVAVDSDGAIIPPCGRCREFIYQVDGRQGETRVILSDKVVALKDLLPEHWSRHRETAGSAPQ